MKILNYTSAILLLILAGFLCGWKIAKNKVQPQKEIVTEVVEKIDTFTVYEPVVVPELIFITDTINVPVFVNGSTIIVPLQRESKTYKGDNYKAVVSGYQPSLDFIETYNITKTEYIRSKPKRWGIGVQAGAGICGGKAKTYIGAGLSYNLIIF